MKVRKFQWVEAGKKDKKLYQLRHSEEIMPGTSIVYVATLTFACPEGATLHTWDIQIVRGHNSTVVGVGMNIVDDYQSVKMAAEQLLMLCIGIDTERLTVSTLEIEEAKEQFKRTRNDLVEILPHDAKLLLDNS